MAPATNDGSIERNDGLAGANDGFAVRRVVVALDAVGDATGALAAAGELARRWHCGLAGVFVVDAALTQLAGFPEVRQVCFAGGGCQTLMPADLEADIRAREARARRALADAARRAGTTFSFSVLRGGFSPDRAGLAADDLLVVEGALRMAAGRTAFEARWRRVAEAAAHPVLMLRRRGGSRPGPVLCLYDGSPAAARGLAAAARLAGDRDAQLVVIADADAESLQVRMPLGRPPRIMRPPAGGWRRAVAAARPSLVVAPAGAPADTWSEAGDADILLVR
ncbi:MAG: hypothetical protein AB7P02_28025 [Alphaproteobacteria bacterium]